MKLEKKFFVWYCINTFIFGLVVIINSFLLEYIGNNLNILFLLIPSVIFLFVPWFHICAFGLSRSISMIKPIGKQKNKFKNYFPKWWILFLSILFAITSFLCIFVFSFLSTWTGSIFILFNTINIIGLIISSIGLFFIWIPKNKIKIQKKI